MRYHQHEAKQETPQIDHWEKAKTAGWMLIHNDTGEEVKPGDSFILKGQVVHADIFIGRPPQHPASTGRIYVVPSNHNETTYPQGYFPSVLDCRWVARVNF